ncbi:hypothetical protein SGLAM104S_08796 [Streptomyces glaucescens]
MPGSNRSVPNSSPAPSPAGLLVGGVPLGEGEQQVELRREPVPDGSGAAVRPGSRRPSAVPVRWSVLLKVIMVWNSGWRDWARFGLRASTSRSR